jgi:hypothetical protein
LVEKAYEEYSFKGGVTLAPKIFYVMGVTRSVTSDRFLISSLDFGAVLNPVVFRVIGTLRPFAIISKLSPTDGSTVC